MNESSKRQMNMSNLIDRVILRLLPKWDYFQTIQEKYGLRVPPETKIRDPLSEVTRKERRTLLLVSTVGIVIVKLGIIPEKISALGIEFTSHNQQAFLSFWAFVIGYFVVAFGIYGISDFISWRLSFVSDLERLVKEKAKNETDPRRSPKSALPVKPGKRIPKELDDQYQLDLTLFRWNVYSGLTSVLRILFDFLLPFAIAAYAVFLLTRFYA